MWWHADAVHAVDPVTEQKGWANVMHIPAAPHCAKNATYGAQCGRAFLAGASPDDFTAEDDETGWVGRPSATS